MITLIEKHGKIMQVESVIRTKTKTGSVKQTYTNLGTPIRIWLQTANANTIDTFNARKIKITHSAYLNYKNIFSSIKEGDRLSLDNNAYYIIKGVVNAAGLFRFIRLDVEERI